MARTRRGPNLFEVMSKAPQGQVQRPRPGLLASLLGRNDQRTTSPAAMVAQPLTEEEAVAELAARRASEDAAKLARQEEERSRQEARAAKDEAKRTRQAAKLEEKARREEARQRAAAEAAATSGGNPGAAFMKVAGRRLVLSVNVKGLSLAAACFCLLLLGAFALGRRSIDASPVLTALAPNNPTEPVKPTPPAPPAKATGKEKKEPRKETRTAKEDDPELAELRKVPAARQANMVSPNKPASVEKPAPPPAAPPAESLNYFQIESFMVTKTRSSEQLKDDVGAVRKFLAEKGIATFARRLNSGGYLLFSEQGFPIGADHEAERQAFKKKIQQLGKEYRRAGGLYEFKEPFPVSRSGTQVGQPE